jgi:hypothetical protein
LRTNARTLAPSKAFDEEKDEAHYTMGMRLASPVE